MTDEPSKEAMEMAQDVRSGLRMEPVCGCSLEACHCLNVIALALDKAREAGMKPLIDALGITPERAAEIIADHRARK